jgi:hypothetical protein
MQRFGGGPDVGKAQIQALDDDEVVSILEENV